MEIESTTNQENASLFARGWGSFKALPKNAKVKIVDIAKRSKEIGEEDPRRIVHTLKVGLALTFVSLIYYYRPLYKSFGISGIWAVLTVVVVFEFTVGATLSRSLNRGFATFLAGSLGFGAQHFASLFGSKGEPIALGILVFILAAAATFLRFFPGIKKRYDYGVLIFILTFSLVTVSGYRIENLLELAYQRLFTILLGGSSCMIISIFVCPVWAGEDLHNLVSLNIEKLANYLDGFGGEYFGYSDNQERNKVTNEDDKSFLQAYKSLLASKNTEDSLANYAIWEPMHGRFRLHHPWKQYLKISSFARQCACQLEALNSYITSNDTQVIHKGSNQFRTKIQKPCRTIIAESSNALKTLSSSITCMTEPCTANLHIEHAKSAVKDLKMAIQIASLKDSDILEIIADATVASILIEIVKCVEKLLESVHELSGLVGFRRMMPAASVTSEKPPVLHRGTVKPVLDGDGNYVIITVIETAMELPEKKDCPGRLAGKGQELV